MARAYHLSDEERRKRSERMERLHADPEVEAKRVAALSAAMKRLNAETTKPAGYKPPSKRPGYDQPSRRGERRLSIPVPARVFADLKAIAENKGTTSYSLMRAYTNVRATSRKRLSVFH